MKSILLGALVMVLAAFGLSGAPLLNDPASAWQLGLEYELGAVKVINHTLQVGQAGTVFDYVNRGGQDILFPFQRFGAELTLFKDHRIALLYQPLEFQTELRFREAVTIDDATFVGGSPMRLVYSFPFWRATYVYLLCSGDFTLGLGGALQLRNASIRFIQTDGAAGKATTGQNLGPVPALHLSGRWDLPAGLFLAGEATGLYASSALINGAAFDFEGSLLDASLRFGGRLREGLESFLNLRYLGGSAKGTSQYGSTRWSESAERFTANYLSTVTLSVGFSLR